jgi:hypothetical protein
VKNSEAFDSIMEQQQVILAALGQLERQLETLSSLVRQKQIEGRKTPLESK